MKNCKLLLHVKGLMNSLVILFMIPAAIQAQTQQGNYVSHEVQTDNSVIFRVKAPGAGSVQVFGTWPPNLQYGIPMAKKKIPFLK